MKLGSLWFIAGLLLWLIACNAEQPLSISLTDHLISGEVHPLDSGGRATWELGFDRRLESKEDVRQLASLANWLQQRTGLPIRVHVTPRGGRVVDELCAGEVDFAAVGTVSYLQANRGCGARILVRGRNAQGEDTYRAAIVVHADSALQSLVDLQGYTFAFGAPNSTQGHLIPRLMLQQAGLTLEDLAAHTFNESHMATASAVTSGRYDAGALQDTLAHDLAARGLVRILALSDPYPASGIIAGPDVPAKTVAMVQEALLALEPAGADADALYHWERSEMPRGFVLAHDEDYADLRRIAREIGLLEP